MYKRYHSGAVAVLFYLTFCKFLVSSYDGYDGNYEHDDYGWRASSDYAVNGYDINDRPDANKRSNSEDFLNDQYREDFDDGYDSESLRYGAPQSDEIRGIYVDFIYNPSYYYELSVIKYMINEILDYNENTPFYYDYERLPNSTKITVGPENLILHEQSIITIKTKLLKDIVYNQDIFSRTYAFLYAYFQAVIKDSTKIPEYDRYINFERYSRMFEGAFKKLDAKSSAVCRKDELYGGHNGQLCIFADHEYINSINFARRETKEYWDVLLYRIADFMNILLTSTIRVNASMEHDDCYRIALRPEPDVRSVLLYPHKAVKSARNNDAIMFDSKYKTQIMNDIILFKHRILHALGLGHKYVTPSVMNFYNKPWQKLNMFYIMPEDYNSLQQCYGDPDVWDVPSVYNLAVPNTRNDKRYVRSDATNSHLLLTLFIEDYKRFRSTYANL